MILVGDVHIAADRTRYSVLKVKPRKNTPCSQTFSPRLVNLMETIRWIESVANSNMYGDVFQLGDIVSKSTLDAEELRMIEEISPITQKWIAIRGNHGLSAGGHDSDCAVDFTFMHREPVWEKHSAFVPDESGQHPVSFNIVYLPYVLEKNRNPLSDYLKGMDRGLPTLILSHNDIKGMKYGGITEKHGWSIEELEEWGDFIINAHIHNQQWVTDKILIVGNVDGENLNEDYRIYPHGIWIFDEAAFVQGKAPRECIRFVQNPYAMKFANVEAKNKFDIEKIKAESDDRTILAITVSEQLSDEVQELIDNHLAGGKKIVKADRKSKIKEDEKIKPIENHIEKFKRCAIEEFGELSVIEEI